LKQEKKMGKWLPVTLALVLSCLLLAACQTTPPASKTPTSGKSGQQASSQGPTAQPQQSASQGTQPAAQAQQQAAPSKQLAAGSQQKNAPAAKLASQRTAGKAVHAKKATGPRVSVTKQVGSFFDRIKMFLGIKKSATHKTAPVKATPSVSRGARLIPRDLVPVVVATAAVLAGCCLALAVIIAGRRRGAKRFT
jgi:predicted small secreted protein